MKLFRHLAVWGLLFAALASCDNENDGPKGEYEHGAFIINEGGFGSSNGSVTFVNLVSLAAEQNIFRATGSEFAGDIVQSYTVSGDRGYLVINDDNKIEVVNANTFAPIETISDPQIVKPRYVEVIGNKAYISVWGDYDENYMLKDSRVVVYDLNARSVVKSIKTDNGVENLLYNGEYLFAASNNFGMTDTLTVIDPSTNAIVKEIKLSYGPAGMVVDANNDLWIVATGSYLGNDGKLFKIDTETLTVIKEFAFTMNLGGDLCLTSDKKNVLFHSGNLVYKISIDATQIPANPIFEAGLTEPYSLSLDPSTDEIYLGDALDYQSPGKVYVYGLDGALSHTIEAGINPTQVVFK